MEGIGSRVRHPAGEGKDPPVLAATARRAGSVAARMASASLAPFRSRNFRLMWIGALLSNIGTWMETVGLTYYVAHTTGRPSSSALVGAAGFLPNGVIGPIGSAMADRWSRRRMLVVGNALSAVVAAILAVWVGGGTATPLGIAGLSFVAGSIGAFTFPSFQSTLPDLVERGDLVAAIGLSNAQWNLGRIVGPSLAALAISLGGIGTALWCNAFSFFAVIVAVAFVRVPRGNGDRRPVLRALADGIRFARRHAGMRRMLVLMLLTISIASPFIAFVSQMATTVFHGDAKATSVLVTAQGIGAVSAAFTLGAMTKRYGLVRVMVGAIVALSPALVLYAIAPQLWLSGLALIAVGWAYGYAFTTFAGTAQEASPDDMRGRVLAVNFIVLGVMFPVGSLIQGRIADSVGLRWTTAGSGMLLALALAVVVPVQWRARAADAVATPATASASAD
jgi:MFS family permease